MTSTVFVIAGDTPAEIEAAKGPVRQQISFYASTPAYVGVLEAHGWGEVGRRLTDKSKRGEWTGMADEITDEMLDVYAITCTWDELADKVQAKYKGYLDRVGFYFPMTGEPERWRKMVRAFNG